MAKKDWSEYRRVKPCAFAEHFTLKLKAAGTSDQCVLHDAHEKIKGKITQDQKAKHKALKDMKQAEKKKALEELSKKAKEAAAKKKSLHAFPPKVDFPENFKVEIKDNGDPNKLEGVVWLNVATPPSNATLKKLGPTPTLGDALKDAGIDPPAPTSPLATTLLAALDNAGGPPVLDNEWAKLKQALDKKYKAEGKSPSPKFVEAAEKFEKTLQDIKAAGKAILFGQMYGVPTPLGFEHHTTSKEAVDGALATSKVCPNKDCPVCEWEHGKTIDKLKVETPKPVTVGSPPPTATVEMLKDTSSGVTPPIKPGYLKNWKFTPSEIAKEIVETQPIPPSTAAVFAVEANIAKQIAADVDKVTLDSLGEVMEKKVKFENLDYECIRKVKKSYSVWRAVGNPDRIVLVMGEADPTADKKTMGMLRLDTSRDIEVVGPTFKVPVEQEGGDFVAHKPDAQLQITDPATVLWLAARFGFRIVTEEKTVFSTIAVKQKKPVQPPDAAITF